MAAGACGRGGSPEAPPSPMPAVETPNAGAGQAITAVIPSPAAQASPAADATPTATPPAVQASPVVGATPVATPPVAQASPAADTTPATTPTDDRRQTQSTPTPASSVAATARPARAVFDLRLLSVPICVTSSVSGVVRGFGTVPAPTPTPTATPVVRPTPRSLRIASREVGEYLALAGPAIQAATHWTGITENQWPNAQTLESRGALVFAESRRIAALCNGIALADAPPEAGDANRELAAALTGRQKWAADAASLLRDSMPASAASLESARSESAAALDAALAALESLAARFDLTLSPGADSRVLDNNRGRVSLQVPLGWFVVRADSQSVLVAPPDLQVTGIEGLGPGREGYGSALRVRRLRNAPGQTLSDILVNVSVLLDEFGELRRTRDIVVDGHAGVEWQLASSDTGWQTWFAVTLAGDFTFIIEMGCPGEVSSECDRIMRETLAGARLRP